MYISVGYDYKILVHRAADGCLLREIKNNFGGKEINCTEVSVYHNLIVVGSHSSSSLYLWNYEFGKLLGEIRLDGEVPVALHVINGFGLLVVATNTGNLHMFRMTMSSSDIELEAVGVIQVDRNIVNVYTDLKLAGRGKATMCSTCKLTVFCEGGELFEFDLSEFISGEGFKLHCKEKTSYNPYRECKENFISELQKMKHTVLDLQHLQQQNRPDLQQTHLSPTSDPFGYRETMFTQLSSLSLCKLLKMEQIYHVVVGNDRRIKIWNDRHQLLCDLNINVLV